MKFEKTKLCNLPSCYAVSTMNLQGRMNVLFAPDAYGPCRSFDLETQDGETIWDEPSGTMSIVPVPHTDDSFLAVQLFNPDFQASGARIVHAIRCNGKWDVKTLFTLPYVHRFDILQRGGVSYIICCTVCTTKDSTDDWSSPGAIYVAELPEDLSTTFELKPIAEGMHRNHGYCRVQGEDFEYALTSCDEGVFEVIPPEGRDGDWQLRKILDKPVSDIAVCDIDGDGINELAVLEPFHGDTISVYKLINDSYEPVYKYPGKTSFCHVVWGGKIRGVPAFIFGCRRERKELFLLKMEEGRFETIEIESGAGPSNITVVNMDDEDLILVANREIGEGSMFRVSD